MDYLRDKIKGMYEMFREVGVVVSTYGYRSADTIQAVQCDVCCMYV